MAPRLPARYQTQVRLGRDGDVEEWLSIDTSLDRPVLVRVLDPDASASRRAEFMDGARAAAAVQHVHLAGVYAVGEEHGAAYSVLEWYGGVSIADRLHARETIPVEEFLPNAAGLASALAALHATGAVHGNIDPSAIGFSASHPAKLTAFGRHGKADQVADTAGLARSLRLAITGTETPGLSPSQVAEGLPPAVDAALDDAERGRSTAESLAASLRAIPFTPVSEDRTSWSWRWLIPAALLLVGALLISAAGMAMDVDPDSPFLFPATPPAPPASRPPAADTTTTAPPPAEQEVLAFDVAVHDPFGDGEERDRDLPLLADGDLETAWRTESYSSPLTALKPGVGLVFFVAGSPTDVEIAVSPGSNFGIAWTRDTPDSFENWEFEATATADTGITRLELPERDNGLWLLWFTDLPAQSNGKRYASIAEIQFLS
jgi:hypothetical protein